MARRVVGLNPGQVYFFWKFVSVCEKNHLGLWEKFGEQSIVLDNSHQFVGKIRSATTSTAMVAAGTPATLETVQQQQQHGIQQQQVSERETRANKKRRLLLSSGNETPNSNRSPVTPATPGGIPQVDGGDSGPSTPELEPKFRDPPTPPPMSQFLPADPNRVICHLCFKNVHFLMYDQCEACHYRLKYAYKLLWFCTLHEKTKKSIKNQKTKNSFFWSRKLFALSLWKSYFT